MWIAKPIQTLSDVELRQWIQVCAWRRRMGEEVPLAQTLTWNRAATLGGNGGMEAYAVFTSQENVGGIVLRDASANSFDCVNGPLLDWGKGERTARQLATFAHAVSRLRLDFRKLTLRPRWPSGETSRRLAQVPVEPRKIDRASTVLLDLHDDWQAGITRRLQRTLQSSARAYSNSGVHAISSEEGDLDFADSFGEKMAEYGRARGFMVPHAGWFRELIRGSWVSGAEGIRFLRASANLGDGAVDAELLIAVHGGVAHYLFGCESRRPGVRGAWSAQSIAQFEALRACTEQGLSRYDLNGFIRAEECDPSHPYSRVVDYKAQWGGAVVDYEIPEIVITET